MERTKGDVTVSHVNETSSEPRSSSLTTTMDPQSLSFPEQEDHFSNDEHDAKPLKTLRLHLGISFFIFGLINNVLYVIILSAALDLVPASTPKGVILFCNIFPSLIAKVTWPYLLKGRIRYTKRLLGCAILSTTGMIVVALFNTIYMRLLGICLASFSSGLGELTFLQLSNSYLPPQIASHAIGYFASGTGAAGLVGAFLWWELRNLGVRLGVGVSCILPSVIPIAYFFLLPKSEMFFSVTAPASSLTEGAESGQAYEPLATAEDEEDVELEGEEEHSFPSGLKHTGSLSMQDKWRLVKPLLARYMLPLCE